MPPVEEIIEAAHDRGIPVVVDGAQLAPHRALPGTADFVAWSGHKMYAPFGAGVLVGPRSAFTDGDPFLAGGGAVDLVGLDEVVWTSPPDREEAGSPNVVGAVALHAAMDALREVGWPTIIEHDRRASRALRGGLMTIPGVKVLGPASRPTPCPWRPSPSRACPSRFWRHGSRSNSASVSATVASVRTPTSFGFSDSPATRSPDSARTCRRGDRHAMPGAVRASCGINTTDDDIRALLDAVALIAAGLEPPFAYFQESRDGRLRSRAGLRMAGRRSIPRGLVLTGVRATRRAMVSLLPGPICRRAPLPQAEREGRLTIGLAQRPRSPAGYVPPCGSAKDPVNMLGYIAENVLSGLAKTVQWNAVDSYRAQGAQFVDVRTREEFARGTLPGAINIPVDELRERLSELEDTDIVVNCQVGQRGHTAALLLNELGFRARNLDGGYRTWHCSPAAAALQLVG